MEKFQGGVGQQTRCDRKVKLVKNSKKSVGSSIKEDMGDLQDSWVSGRVGVGTR